MRSVAMGEGVNKGADAVVGREAIEAEIAMMVREALDKLLRRSAAEEFAIASGLGWIRAALSE